jgi:hypothetical protein
VRKKTGHLKSIDGIDFYKWATIKNKFCKKIKEILIVHPELSLGISHPGGIKWIYQIPLILLINIEHYVFLQTVPFELLCLGISVACDCLIDEVKQIYE